MEAEATVMATARAERVPSDESRWRAWAEILRPANVVTAAADILAGSAIAGVWNGATLTLIPAGMALYAGGVVLNDFFDRDLDARERPERPLPSGRIGAASAGLAGLALLAAGVGIAWLVSASSAMVAAAVAAAVLSYDSFGKHVGYFGPANMGLCRGLNLLLGATVGGALLWDRWMLALIPLVYIAAITTLAKGEVHGGSRSVVRSTILVVVVTLALMPVLAGRYTGPAALWALPFLGLWAWRVLPPLQAAWQSPEPKRVFAAVKAGVLSLMILNAAIAAAFLGPAYGVALVALALVAARLARFFAVT